MVLNSVVLVVIAYLLGSIPNGYLIGRLRGMDIRQRGDQYTGATNVTRALGMKAGIATAAGDVAKGAIALLLVKLFPVYPVAVVLAGIAVVAGHIWPVSLGFHGGAGLATTLGVVMIALPREALILVFPFLALAYLLGRRIGLGLTGALLYIPLLLLGWLLKEQAQFVLLPAILGPFIGVRMYWHQIVGFLQRPSDGQG